jgi:asparagine synthase (glutamine-hydrolysing)
MCGICGWIELSPGMSSRPVGSNLEAMSATIEHRGPDDWGKAEFEDAAIAMTRLSIIDLDGGHQPISNDRRDCYIVFNGEIYNFQELRRELEDKGYCFKTRSDTEVVLRAYEEWGDDCVSRLRGMFAFAIYDRRPSVANGNSLPDSGRLFLARDRVGKKPLYYYTDGNQFIFGSEIKAILAHPSVRRRVNQSVIALYLSYGYVPAPHTFFKHIYELPPACILTVQNGEMKVAQYWAIPTRRLSDPASTEAEAIERLRELFEQAVKIRLVSDVPLGAFLSGGVDSSAIVAVMSRLVDQPVKTFAIGFSDDPSFNELEYARLVAERCRTDHHEFIVSPDAIKLLPQLVWHYDQPFADSSAIAMYLVSKLTREHVTVTLTGDGGDELFAGYKRFTAARVARLYRHLPQFLQTGVADLLSIFPESTNYAGFVQRARRFVHHASRPLAENYLGWIAIFQDRLIQDLLVEKPEVNPLTHFKTYFDDVHGLEQVDQLLAVHAKTCLPGDLLVKTDRMTMAHSLEARCPFLDQELIDFAAQLPQALKIRGLTGKYILKKALVGIVPPEIIHRKKHGFGVPVGYWFRTSLKDYVRDLLLCPQALRRGYFREESLRNVVEEHQSGRRDHGHKLWALLTFEIWHRMFIDQDVAPFWGADRGERMLREGLFREGFAQSG